MSDTPRTDAEAYPGEWEAEAVDAEVSRKLERENNELLELVKLLTIEEISDSGRTFCPTKITSCRCIDLEKIHTILQKYK